MRLTLTSATVAWVAAVVFAYVLNRQGAEFAAVLALIIPGATLYRMAKES